MLSARALKIHQITLDQSDQRKLSGVLRSVMMSSAELSGVAGLKWELHVLEQQLHTQEEMNFMHELDPLSSHSLQRSTGIPALLASGLTHSSLWETPIDSFLLLSSEEGVFRPEDMLGEVIRCLSS
ncbi:unnamed protein product [Leuciscus chuanchicus]